MSGGPQLLRLESISKAFPGVQALRNVTLAVDRGECLAVVGENGAGKSTLLNILGGVIRPDAGSVLIDGQPHVLPNVRASQSLGIRLIHQELVLAPDLTVAENILLGRQPSRGPRWLPLTDRRRMQEFSRAILDRLGVRIAPQTIVDRLDMAHKQVVEIARAVSAEARIFVFDEPTSSLSTTEASKLLTLIEQLRDDGAAIIYVSHRLDEVMRIADQAMVLRDGEHVATLPRAALSPAKLAHAMVGRDLQARTARAYRKPATRRPALEVRRLQTTASSEPASFDIHPGEIVGFAGLVGAGRTELARALFGVDGPIRGDVRIDDREAKISSPVDAVRSGLALAPDDRKALGLLGDLSVRANIGIIARPKLSRWGRYNRRGEARLANHYRAQLNVRTTSVEKKASLLSGGNQQKVVLAKWLAAKPKVLILDEPTRGVDMGARQEIYRLIDRLAAEGLAVMVISNEIEELIQLASRVLVMRKGRVVGELSGDAITEHAIMNLAVGLAEVGETND